MSPADLEILRHLAWADARVTVAEVARETGLARSTVRGSLGRLARERATRIGGPLITRHAPPSRGAAARYEPSGELGDWLAEEERLRAQRLADQSSEEEQRLEDQARGARSRLLKITCPCGRILRGSRLCLELGDILCGACGEPFVAADPIHDRQVEAPF